MPSFPANSPMRSGLDAQFSFLTEFARRSCDAMRKLSELNLQFAQQVMQDSADLSRNMLNCTDVFELAAAAAKASEPASEHLRQYQRQLIGVLSGVQMELTRSAEAFAPEAGRYASAMADSMAHAVTQGAGGLGGNGTRYTPRQPQG